MIALLSLMLAADAAALHLVCPGSGLDTEVGSTSMYATSDDGSASASVYQRRAQAFDDQLEIDIEAGAGRVRLPRRIVPAIHGGSGGWYEIKALAVSADAIDGKVPINFTNAPRLHVSRITGAVSLEGRDGSFSGRCQAYDPASVRRAF